MDDPILSFDGPNGFLSNFSECDIWPPWWPRTLPPFSSTEKAFAAWKVDPNLESTEWLALVEQIRSAQNSGQAKRFGRKVPLRAGWEEERVEIMRWLNKQKYRNEHLADLLIATGNSLLVEGNNWNDNYWGACWVGPLSTPHTRWAVRDDGKELVGLNMLGRIEMEIRSDLVQARNSLGV